MLSDRKYDLGLKQSSENNNDSVPLSAGGYPLGNGHRVVFYAGSFEPYQGLSLLVDASAAVVRVRRDVRFLCIGGNDKQIDQLKARAKRREVAEYFVFPGTVPVEDVERHLKTASVVVSARTSGTNTPLKIYSYLRSGVPILATETPPHQQVLTSDVALLVKPRSESIAAGLLKLLDDAKLSRRLARNALVLARNSYSPEAYHKKVAEVYSFLATRFQREK